MNRFLCVSLVCFGGFMNEMTIIGNRSVLQYKLFVCMSTEFVRGGTAARLGRAKDVRL